MSVSPWLTAPTSVVGGSVSGVFPSTPAQSICRCSFPHLPQVWCRALVVLRVVNPVGSLPPHQVWAPFAIQHLSFPDLCSASPLLLYWGFLLAWVGRAPSGLWGACNFAILLWGVVCEMFVRCRIPLFSWCPPCAGREANRHFFCGSRRLRWPFCQRMSWWPFWGRSIPNAFGLEGCKGRHFGWV